MPADAPDLVVLDLRRYVAAYRDFMEDQPGEVWYQHLGLRPRAFLDQRPTPARIVVQDRWADDDMLLAHEYGHWLGHPHPRPLDLPARLIDVMSPAPPRGFTDRHDILPQYRRWRDRPPANNP